ncbi:MAG: fibrobacter succinogenes major paralogous domain-containing protein [Ignavibacteriaceae bacterium]
MKNFNTPGIFLFAFLVGLFSGFRGIAVPENPSPISLPPDYQSVDSVVTIGSQIWKTSNLDVAVYRNGDSIQHAASVEEWMVASYRKKGAWCYYNNDPANGSKHGKLYNWYAVSDPRGLAPEGWRVPTEADFWDLLTAVNYEANSLKAVGLGNGESTGTNTSGLSLLFSGMRMEGGLFLDLDEMAHLWTTTEMEGANASHLMFHKNTPDMSATNTGSPGDGYTVRCIMIRK